MSKGGKNASRVACLNFAAPSLSARIDAHGVDACHGRHDHVFLGRRHPGSGNEVVVLCVLQKVGPLPGRSAARAMQLGEVGVVLRIGVSLRHANKRERASQQLQHAKEGQKKNTNHGPRRQLSSAEVCRQQAAANNSNEQHSRHGCVADLDKCKHRARCAIANEAIVLACFLFGSAIDMLPSR